MVQTSTVAGSARILQFLFSITSLALNGKLTANDSGLSSLVSSLNNYGNSSLSVLQDKTSNGLSLSSSGFTMSSQPILSLASYFTTNVEHEMSELNNARYGINKKQTAYLAGISATEISSIGLWLGTFVYQTAKFGSWDCENPESLIKQYNLTGDALGDGVLDFLGTEDASNTTLGITDGTAIDDELSEILGQLWNLTSQPISISKYNSSGELTKANLMVRLSQDCYIKKASIGVSFFNFIFFVLTSSSVTYSFLKLQLALNSKLASLDGEGKNLDQETGNGDDNSQILPKNKKYKFSYSYANIFPSVKFDV